jgi:hypothetical protein
VTPDGSVCRIGRTHCWVRPSSEPDLHLSMHPAQASRGDLTAITSYDPLRVVGRVVRRSTHHGRWSRRLVCPLVLGVCRRLRLRGSPDHVSALSRPGTSPGIRPVIHGDQLEGLAQLPWFPAAFPLPAFASWSSFPAEGLGLPHGRLTGHMAGPRRGFHVPHARATTGVGALYTPGTTVLTRAGHDHQPASAAPPRLSPCTPPRPPSMRGSALRGINEGSSNSPVRSSPRSTPPDGTGSVFSFPPSFAPRPCEQRTSGRGQATEHGPETTLYVIDLASKQRRLLETCDLVSHS